MQRVVQKRNADYLYGVFTLRCSLPRPRLIRHVSAVHKSVHEVQSTSGSWKSRPIAKGQIFIAHFSRPFSPFAKRIVHWLKRIGVIDSSIIVQSVSCLLSTDVTLYLSGNHRSPATATKHFIIDLLMQRQGRNMALGLMVQSTSP